MESISEIDQARQLAFARVRVLEARIADLERRLPAHSVPPRLILELEDLEEQLSEARQECAGPSSSTAPKRQIV